MQRIGFSIALLISLTACSINIGEIPTPTPKTTNTTTPTYTNTPTFTPSPTNTPTVTQDPTPTDPPAPTPTPTDPPTPTPTHPVPPRMQDSLVEQFPNYSIFREGDQWVVQADSNPIYQALWDGSEWDVIPRQHSCLDGPTNQFVLDQFLDEYGYKSWDEAVNFRPPQPCEICTGYGTFAEHPGVMHFDTDLRVIGGYEFSLEHQSGFEKNDTAVCLLGITPLVDEPVPIIVGIEKNGSYHDLLPFFNYPPPGAMKVEFHSESGTIEDVSIKVASMKNKIILPLMPVKYGSTNWDFDPVWIGKYYEQAETLLRNPNAYIIRNITDEGRIAPKAIDFLSKMMPLLDRSPGGDVGFLARQISVEK